MARISTYVNDTSISDNDKFLGSDGGGSTRNFKIADVTAYLRATNAAGVGGQLTYLYHDGTYNNNSIRQSGTITISGASGQTQQPFSGVSAIKASKYSNDSTKDISNLISTYSSTSVIIADTEDQNQFGIYQVGTVTQDSSETNFYNIPLAYSSGNGNLNNLQSYSISVFTAGDKNLLHTQSSASNSWTVNHNMGKYPSVSIVECDPSANETDGDLVIGEVTYNSINQLTIKFAAAISGVAYIN